MSHHRCDRSAIGVLECACLFASRGETLLVVRVRDNDRWYLPGGKIEAGESVEEALCRELDEELSITVAPGDLLYRCTVEGPALGRQGLVRLICFSCEKPLNPQARNEISDFAWFDRRAYERFAPAVQILYDKWRAGNL